MSTQRTFRIATSCPRCGIINTLIVADVRSSQAVNCSHCGAAMGELANLKFEQLDSSDEAQIVAHGASPSASQRQPGEA